jgi:hypothetical protein
MYACLVGILTSLAHLTLPPDDAIVPHPIWCYKIKVDGTHSARECCNGSPHAAPELLNFVTTDASCIKQPCLRLFFANANAKTYRVLLSNAINANANAHSPTKLTYVHINNVFIDLNLSRLCITLHCSMVG